MAGYNPNSNLGMNAYWGNLTPGDRPPQAPGMRDVMLMQAAQKRRRAPSKEERAAAMEAAQRWAMIDSIRNKFQRSPYLASVDPGMIRAGDVPFEVPPNENGMAYGLDPHSLTPQEASFLGISLANLYANGGSGGGM